MQNIFKQSQQIFSSHCLAELSQAERPKGAWQSPFFRVLRLLRSFHSLAMTI